VCDEREHHVDRVLVAVKLGVGQEPASRAPEVLTNQMPRNKELRAATRLTETLGTRCRAASR
jgi:hypothetical protein